MFNKKIEPSTVNQKPKNILILMLLELNNPYNPMPLSPYTNSPSFFNSRQLESMYKIIIEEDKA